MDVTSANTSAGSGNASAPRSRPRPFANKSTTFNTAQQASSATFGEHPNGQLPPTGPSAFGAPNQAQNGDPVVTSSFNQPSSSFAPSQPASGFGSSTSAFVSTASSKGPTSATAFGNASSSGNASAFGSAPSSSAFGASSAPSSAFGGKAAGSSFGSAFSSSQPQPANATIQMATPVNQPSSQPSAAAAPPSAPAAPASSFSNFLRKDRTGTSTPVDGSGATSLSGGDAGKSLEMRTNYARSVSKTLRKVVTVFLRERKKRSTAKLIHQVWSASRP